MESKCFGKQMRRLLGEIGAEKEYGWKGSLPEYLQFLFTTIRQAVFLIRILEKEVGRGKFSF